MLRLLTGPYLAMPMHWRWAAWFISYAVAVLLALWTRSFVAAVGVWVLLPFVIPWAAFVLCRKRRQLSRDKRRGA